MKFVGNRIVGRVNWVDHEQPIEFDDQDPEEVARREEICRACDKWDGDGCGLLKPCTRHKMTRLHWQRGSCRLGKWIVAPTRPIATAGRGIVTTAGGPVYFLNAYLNFSLLRQYGCTLPVEWFYMGAEMRPEWIAAAERIPGVTLIDLGGSSTQNAKSRGGWQSKIRAVQASSFAELLFVDADSFPRADPAPLFDHQAYREHGVVLWQDCCDWEPDRAAYLNERFGIELPRQQVESGQMLFHKARCGAMLDEVARLHTEPDIYRIVFGDKDTWLIAALRTGTPFRLQDNLRFCLGGLNQADLDGQPFFAHLTNGKFAWKRSPRTNVEAVPGLMHVARIQQELIDYLGGVPVEENAERFSREKRRAQAVGARR